MDISGPACLSGVNAVCVCLMSDISPLPVSMGFAVIQEEFGSLSPETVTHTILGEADNWRQLPEYVRVTLLLDTNLKQKQKTFKVEK